MNRIQKKDIAAHFNGNYLPFYKKYLPDLKPLKGDEHQCCCCFHDDKKPSLSINVKTSQGYCHGCKEKFDIYSFYGKKHGLNGNFPEVLRRIANESGIAEPVQSNQTTRYIYQNAQGKPVHSTVKTADKIFYQESFRNGKWLKGLKGVQPILYPSAVSGR